MLPEILVLGAAGGINPPVADLGLCLVAAGLHPSPVTHAHVVSSTVHKTLGGPRSGIILSNDETLFKKLNSAVFPGQQGGPLMHVIAAKATAFLLALVAVASIVVVSIIRPKEDR